jgi:hypothetical protein
MSKFICGNQFCECNLVFYIIHHNTKNKFDHNIKKYGCICCPLSDKNINNMVKAGFIHQVETNGTNLKDTRTTLDIIGLDHHVTSFDLKFNGKVWEPLEDCDIGSCVCQINPSTSKLFYRHRPTHYGFIMGQSNPFISDGYRWYPFVRCCHVDCVCRYFQFHVTYPQGICNMGEDCECAVISEIWNDIPILEADPINRGFVDPMNKLIDITHITQKPTIGMEITIPEFGKVTWDGSKWINNSFNVERILF